MSPSTTPLSDSVTKKLLLQLDGWSIVESHHLYKTYSFSNFLQPLELLNKVAALAEEEGHHPDLELGWGYLNIKIFTHNINNLTERDFILAAKIDAL